MAPGAVLPSHLTKAVAYAMPRTAEGLRGAGVRIAGAESLATLIADAAAELGLSSSSTGAAAGGAGGGGGSRAMRLGVVTPAAPWMYAVYKPKTKKGCPPEPPTWEVSWSRFQERGDAVETIALTQASARGVVQKGTVVGHLLEALTHGRPVDFARMCSGLDADSLSLPDEAEWGRLEDAAAAAAMDPKGDPGGFAAREVLRAVLGGDAVDKDRELKTEAERGAESAWYGKIRVWTALKRAEHQPQWVGGGEEPDAKKPRLG